MNTIPVIDKCGKGGVIESDLNQVTVYNESYCEAISGCKHQTIKNIFAPKYTIISFE